MLSGGGLSRAVDSQALDSGASRFGHAFDLSCFRNNSEVFAPHIAAWMKEVNAALRLFIERGDGIGFVKIAGATRESQIVCLRFAAGSLRRDVFDFKR